MLYVFYNKRLVSITTSRLVQKSFKINCCKRYRRDCNANKLWTLPNSSKSFKKIGEIRRKKSCNSAASQLQTFLHSGDFDDTQCVRVPSTCKTFVLNTGVLIHKYQTRKSPVLKKLNNGGMIQTLAGSQQAEALLLKCDEKNHSESYLRLRRIMRFFEQYFVKIFMTLHKQVESSVRCPTSKNVLCHLMLKGTSELHLKTATQNLKPNSMCSKSIAQQYVKKIYDRN